MREKKVICRAMREIEEKGDENKFAFKRGGGGACVQVLGSKGKR